MISDIAKLILDVFRCLWTSFDVFGRRSMTLDVAELISGVVDKFRTTLDVFGASLDFFGSCLDVVR